MKVRKTEMAEVRKWTEAQRRAIELRSPSLLVSAAAGSGKTAVLTRRIIERLTDPDNPTDISRLLIVTFTRAAAGELREKIAKALGEAIIDHPEMKKQLRRQIILLEHAKISTIHSFCLDTVRSNFATLGVPADSRVADQMQTDLLIRKVMDEVVESYYNAAPDESDVPDFSRFADNLIALKDEKLPDKLYGIYKSILPYSEGIGFIEESARKYRDAAETTFWKSAWAEAAKKEIRNVYSSFSGVYEKINAYIDTEADFAPYHDAFASDLSHIGRVLSLIEDEPEEAYSLICDYESPSLGRVSTDKQNDKIITGKSLRKEFNEARKKIIEKYKIYSEEEYKKSAVHSAEFCEDLAKVLRKFENRYTSEKRKRSLLDFSDLEKLTLSVFVKDGRPTEQAINTAAQFDEIFIDEYQDTNDLQDKIFSSLTTMQENGAAKFIVGDIKQSIYGFRGAEPSLFASYRQSPETDKVFLQHNFRCDRPIIDFVNAVCGYLFTKGVTSVPYGKEDDLVFGKNEDHEPVLPEIAILKKQEDSEINPETLYVASRIRGMITSGKRKPGDIAILLRSDAGRSVEYEKALSRAGIPVFNQTSEDLFKAPEVLLALCLLRCVNNPENDIALAGLLKSPLFGFTLDELIRIREMKNDGSLYSAVKNYEKWDETGKTERFLEKLTVFRKMAEAAPADELIRRLYSESGIIEITSGFSGNAEDNLMTLYELARSYETGSFRGLYNFLSFIEEMIQNQGYTSGGKANIPENAVRIYTIHQSKGLEFPVCFLCGTSKKANTEDTREEVLMDKSTGISPKLKDDTGYAYFDTVFRKAVSADIVSGICEEEMRILYVALTRAREELIITAADSDPEKLVSEIELNSVFTAEGPGYYLRRNMSYIKWILHALKSTGFNGYRLIFPDDPESTAAAVKPDTKECCEEPFITEEELRSRLNFIYPYHSLAKIPAKLSVSGLYPDLLDEGEGKLNERICEDDMKEPLFISDDPEIVTAAQKGTATHVFMQFCDFGMAEISVESEINRLTEQKFISPKTADLIDPEEIKRFFGSEFYAEIRNSGHIWRETRFNIKLPAAGFTEDPAYRDELTGEEILVQGVADCIYENPDGTLTVADYKTDRIPRRFRKDRAGFEALLIERHSRQLGYYRKTVEQIFRRKVSALKIYSFALGKSIDLGNEE